MTFILIFSGFLFIVYIVSYLNRDKALDNRINRYELSSPGDSTLAWEVSDAIETTILESKKEDQNIRLELLILKEKLLNNLPSISKKFNVERASARLTIVMCFEPHLKEYK